MKAQLIAAAIILVLAAIAIRVSLAAKPYTPLLVDQHNSGAWLNYASLDERFCDVRPDPPRKPRGQYDYIPGAKRQGAIA